MAYRIVAILTLCLVIACLIYGIVQRDHRIADLEERNAALSRLCGPERNAAEVWP